MSKKQRKRINDTLGALGRSGFDIQCPESKHVMRQAGLTMEIAWLERLKTSLEHLKTSIA